MTYFSVRKVSLPDGSEVTDSKGGGKGLFRTSLGVYKSLGITKISVHANIDVGGYAWAKYGFKITQRHWDILRKEMKNSVKGIALGGSSISALFTKKNKKYASHLSSEVKSRLLEILDDPDPYALFTLSDFKDVEEGVGKALLLGADWHGNLDLDDPILHDRCMGYIANGR